MPELSASPCYASDWPFLCVACRAVVVPSVLFVSVLLLMLAWYKLSPACAAWLDRMRKAPDLHTGSFGLPATEQGMPPLRLYILQLCYNRYGRCLFRLTPVLPRLQWA